MESRAAQLERPDDAPQAQAPQWAISLQLRFQQQMGEQIHLQVERKMEQVQEQMEQQIRLQFQQVQKEIEQQFQQQLLQMQQRFEQQLQQMQPVSQAAPTVTAVATEAALAEPSSGQPQAVAGDQPGQEQFSRSCSKGDLPICRYCGCRSGRSTQCPAWGHKCMVCKKTGHFEYMCFSPN